jgi:hypothetical protein
MHIMYIYEWLLNIWEEYMRIGMPTKAHALNPFKYIYVYIYTHILVYLYTHMYQNTGNL